MERKFVREEKKDTNWFLLTRITCLLLIFKSHYLENTKRFILYKINFLSILNGDFL